MSKESDELDDFESIENSGKLNNQISFSSVYSVKVGGFGQQQLKTYISCITVEELEEDIQFYETLSKDKSWPVSQIIQREVDKIRVTNISKDYILGKGRVVKYFPPIIVALLPKSSDDKIDLKYDFTTDQSVEIKELIYEKSEFRNNDKLKKIFSECNNLAGVQGLYLLQVSKVFDLNVLCWDKTKYYAVVIDGQHRLDALIKSKKDSPEISKYIQDVVFIDFSELVKNGEEKYTPIELVRRVFIDINTNAKKVGIVRQILMDDKDLASLLVQSLVDSVNKDGSDKLSSTFIKSQIVDWYGESLKHTLPHITGILSLYQVLSDYLIQYNISSIDDLRNPKMVVNWIKRMNDYFFVDTEIGLSADYKDIQKLTDSLEKFNEERTLVNDYADAIEDELRESALFQYDYTVLEIAQKTFEKIYAKSIVKIFEQLLPYKETIETIENLKGFESNSLLSLALLSSRKKISSSSRLKECLHDIRKSLEENLYPKYFLLFSVLGQKALFNIYFKRVFKEFNSSFTEEKCLNIADKFIKDINLLLQICSTQEKKPFGKKEAFVLDLPEDMNEEIVDLGTIIKQFWEGIIYEDNRIIYNTQGIQSLTSMLDFMLSCIEALRSDVDIDHVPFQISFMKARTARVIRKRFDDLDEDSFSDIVIREKEKFIKAYLKNAYNEHYKV